MPSRFHACASVLLLPPAIVQAQTATSFGPAFSFEQAVFVTCNEANAMQKGYTT